MADDWKRLFIPDAKSCPFCGGTRIIVDREQRGPGYDDYPDDPDRWAYFGFCTICAAQGPWVKSNREGAIQKWNTRAEDYAARVAELRAVVAREHVAVARFIGDGETRLEIKPGAVAQLAADPEMDLICNADDQKWPCDVQPLLT